MTAHQNYIKRQAKEHEGFRLFAIAQAQRVHRIDMRMRLGILHDHAAQERMAERERKREEDKKRLAEVPTVMTEAQQQKADKEAEREKADGGKSAKKEEKAPAIKIRPLSEAKAIELGANFFSETFIFMVAAGLLVWDSWRTRSKAKDKREELADRLDIVEAEVDRLRNKYEPGWEALGEQDEKEEPRAWWNPASWWTRTDPAKKGDDASAEKQGAQQGTLDVVKQKVEERKAAVSTAMQKPKDAAVAKDRTVEQAEDAAKRPPERVDEVTASNKNR